MFLCLVLSCGTSTAVPPDAASEATGDISSPPSTSTWVMRRVFAGDSDRTFKPSATAWRALGADIDGKTTSASSSDVCARWPNAPASVQEDGDAGIDNSFGANVVPAILALNLPSPSLQWSQATTQGAVRVGLLTRSPQGIELRLGAIPPGPIPFDGSGVWPVSTLSLKSDRVTPTAAWSGSLPTPFADGPAVFTIPLNNGTLVLRVRHVALRGALENGVVSGVLRTSELIESMRQVLGANKSQCSGAMVDAMSETIRSAQDILEDGTQDPQKPCDAISIGLGFEGTPMKLGDVQDDKGPSTPCP